MAGQRIDETIGKIIRAHDITGHEKRSFSVYSFIEEDIDFSTILDKEWQEKYIHQLKKFKLIIIDNFYSLISAHDPTNFIKWMRGLTKEGISFLVVDHTNSEGELQGSMDRIVLVTGMLFSIVGISGVIASPVWGIVGQKWGFRPALYLALLGSGIFGMIQAIPTTLVPFGVWRFIGGLAFAGIFPAINAVLSQSSAPEDRGRIFGLSYAAQQVGSVIGPVGVHGANDTGREGRDEGPAPTSDESHL